MKGGSPVIGIEDKYDMDIIDDLIDLINKKNSEKVIYYINNYDSNTQNKILEELSKLLKRKDLYEWYISNIEIPYNKIHDDDYSEYEIGYKDTISNEKLRDLEILVKNRERRRFIRKLNKYNLKKQVKIIDKLYDLLKTDEDSFKWFIKNIEKSHNKFVKKYKKNKKTGYNYVYQVQNMNQNNTEPTIGTNNPYIPNLYQYIIDLVRNKDTNGIINVLNKFDQTNQKQILDALYYDLSGNQTYFNWYYDNVYSAYKRLYDNIILLGGKNKN